MYYTCACIIIRDFCGSLDLRMRVVQAGGYKIAGAQVHRAGSWKTAREMGYLLFALMSLHVACCWLQPNVDAAASCGPSPTDGDLRLVHWNPSLRSCGRVEVYMNGSWGTVCDNSWHKRDADVVCRQLGFTQGSRFRCHAACFGEGEGKVWIDALVCPRGGSKLMQCKFKEWGEHDCTHASDVGVCCKGDSNFLSPPLVQNEDTRVRVSCPCVADGACRSCAANMGPSPGYCPEEDDDEAVPAVEGMVEVSFGDTWVPVSAGAWSEEAASVACSELGYPVALFPTAGFSDEECTEAERLRLGRATGILSHVVTSVRCSGSESVLANCTLETGAGSSSFCAARLSCGFLPHPDCPNNNRVSSISTVNNK